MRPGRFGLLLAIGALVAGCGVAGGSTQTDRPALDATITAVRIDNDSGALTVRTGAPALERTLRFRGTAPTQPTHRIEGGTLVLGTCGYNCSVDYTVTVPAGLPVSGRTASGALSLTGVGRVDVETSSGAVEIDGADAVRVNTSNGAITGRGLRGTVDATTSNGRIELALTTAQDVRARTSNGAITLTVPRAAYRVVVSTTNGNRDLRIPDDPAGAHTLDLTTTNGAVTVAPV
ncbi:hypothetical protein GCM10009836_14310 [Pseudonocardia ailaonensis]|uniref:DUF4097 domain-containing protein n=1 Tax=Pseudonocardia ailaonensis TaxID=367279 RepID=A0ABN2MS96_9PSEU